VSGDYKWDIQLIAEEMAMEQYGKEFYDLSSYGQQAVYEQAMDKYHNRLADRADYLRKAQREDELR
jgi:hypothetical protein